MAEHRSHGSGECAILSRVHTLLDEIKEGTMDDRPENRWRAAEQGGKAATEPAAAD